MLKPRLVTSDLRVRLQAAIRGIGIALLLPSVRSLIDFLLIHVPAWLQERSFQPSKEGS